MGHIHPYKLLFGDGKGETIFHDNSTPLPHYGNGHVGLKCLIHVRRAEGDERGYLCAGCKGRGREEMKVCKTSKSGSHLGA